MNQQLDTVRTYAEKSPGVFTEASIRWLIFNEKQNGLAKTGAIIRVGRKVLINTTKFNDWLNSKSQAAA